MDSDAAVLGAVSIQAAFRVIELSLHLFAFLFPKQEKVKDNCSYDFIIVGGGSAGCLLANRLSANENFNVLLIEAGDNPTLEVMLPGLALFNQRSQFDWNLTTVNDKYTFQCYKDNVFRTARGHGMSGSGSLNFMLYARGDPHDFAEWADITDDYSWAYPNILKYFKKSERMENQMVLNSKYRRFHGTKGEMGINIVTDETKLKYLNALNEVGYKTVLDTNGRNTLGFNFPMYNIAQGTRQSSCYCYVSPIKDRKNLFVMRNTKVNKVIFDGNKAVGVEITNSNTKSIISANLEVILSAGAFSSPQILMLSGIGPKEHLESFDIPVLADLPVGYNLLDHTGIIIAHQTDTYNEEDAPQFNPYGPPLLTLNGFVALNESQTYPDAQFIVGSSVNANNLLQLFAFSLNLDDDIAQRIYEANKEKEILFTYILNLRPLSTGYVSLRSADPRDPPNIHLKTFSNKTDLHNVVRYIKDYLRIEQSTYFQDVNAQRVDLPGDRCKGFDKDSDEYWQCYSLCIMISMYHYSGTCSMGSVVDSSLRVMGVQGLRVVDTSVFPTIPSANTNAATLMVAEKAADMIKMDYYF